MSNPSPELTSPGRPTIAGDTTDDDGQVINSLTQGDATPPIPTELPTVDLGITIKAPPMTRLMTGSMVVPNTWAPVMILPADPNRKTLKIRVQSATATDYIRVSDDPGKLQFANLSYLGYISLPVELDGHTGPVWLSAPDGTGPVTVTYAAVTS